MLGGKVELKYLIRNIPSEYGVTVSVSINTVYSYMRSTHFTSNQRQLISNYSQAFPLITTIQWKPTGRLEIPSHFSCCRKMPCISWPHMSQKVGPRKVYFLNRWGMSILNLSFRYCKCLQESMDHYKQNTQYLLYWKSNTKTVFWDWLVISADINR